MTKEGVHHAKFATYGHSLVVDPWGQIIAERTEPGSGVLMARICHEPSDTQSESVTAFVTRSVRCMLPVVVSRRHDLLTLSEIGQPVGKLSFLTPLVFMLVYSYGLHSLNNTSPAIINSPDLPMIRLKR